MSINNKIELTGHMSRVGIDLIETEKSNFASFSLATTNSYKDNKSNKWVNKSPIWHRLIAFNPSIIETLVGLNSKDRIKVTATLDYRSIPNVEYKREASLIVIKIEEAPLTKK